MKSVSVRAEVKDKTCELQTQYIIEMRTRIDIGNVAMPCTLDSLLSLLLLLRLMMMVVALMVVIMTPMALKQYTATAVRIIPI